MFYLISSALLIRSGLPFLSLYDNAPYMSHQITYDLNEQYECIGVIIMIYVMSDLHGCLEKFLEMIKLIRLSEKDTLYILGDIMDRAPLGPDIILDIAGKDNIISLLGNHDYAAMKMLKTFGMNHYSYAPDILFEPFTCWLKDGGSSSYERFILMKERERAAVLKYIEEMPLYRKVRIGGESFLLSHTVPERNKMDDISLCTRNDFIFGEPQYDVEYFRDMTVITGHTPTGLIDSSFTGRIWKGNGHIAVDCGAVFGKSLGCICLDTGEEFYV